MARLKKRADGRYMQWIKMGVDTDGKTIRKAIYARTQAQLEEKIMKLTNPNSLALNPKEATMANWADKWINTYKPNIEFNTRRMYEGIIKTYILPSFENIYINSITMDNIQQLLNAQIMLGHDCTAQKIYITLHQIFDVAFDLDIIKQSPMLKIKKPKYVKPTRRAFTAEEENIILSCDLPLKEKTFIYMLLYTGLRRGEILALTKQDINMRAEQLNVNKSIIIKSNKPEIKTKPKTKAGNRQVPLIDVLRPVLAQYMFTLKTDVLFPNEEGQYMSASTFRGFWDSIIDTIDNAGAIAKDIVPHLFRHNFATKLIYADCNIKEAQTVIGHESAAFMLDLYTHVKTEVNSTVKNRLNTYVVKHVVNAP